MPKEKVIAVTGSSGFIGSLLVKKLKEKNVIVLELDIKNGIDLTDWKQVKEIDKIDILFHLAGKTFVPDSYNYPREFYQTNIVSTINAAELCRHHKAKMIFTSSYVYGEPKYLPIDEDHPVNAFNPYASSKIICEHLCRSFYFNFGVNIIIFRPFNAYGIGQNKHFLISSIIHQAKSGEIILKDPSPKRDFFHVDDLIRAYIKAVEYNKTGFEVFNIGSGISYSVQDVVNSVCELQNYKIEVKFTGDRRKNEVMNTVADISKAKKLLNWKPIINLQEGLRRIIESSEVDYKNS